MSATYIDEGDCYEKMRKAQLHRVRIQYWKDTKLTLAKSIVNHTRDTELAMDG